MKLRDWDGVIVATCDGVLGASKEGVAGIVCDVVGVPTDEDLDFVEVNVKVGAGLTVSVAILDKVSEAVLVMSSVTEGVATRDREGDVLNEVVTDRESEVVVVSVREFVSDSWMVLDSLISRESVAEIESEVVAVMDMVKLCDADSDWVVVAVNVCEAVGLGLFMMNQIVRQLPTGTSTTYSSMGTLYRFGNVWTAGLKRLFATESELQLAGIELTSEVSDWSSQRVIVVPEAQLATVVKSVPVTVTPVLHPE